MIMMTVLVRRNPELSVEEFRRHWRDVHGPLIRDTPSLARHVLRYEQNPVVDGDAGGGFDGVATLWFRSLEGFWDFVSEPAYHEVVAPDERSMLDLPATRMAFTEVGEATTVIAAEA